MSTIADLRTDPEPAAVAMRELTISLPIADRRAALAFYHQVFGWEAVGEPEEDGVPEPLQFRLDRRTLLALIPASGLGWVLGDRPVAPAGVSECLLGVTLDAIADVDRLVERFSQAGGDVIAGPGREDWGYTALCTDLDGHVWQLTAPSPEAS